MNYAPRSYEEIFALIGIITFVLGALSFIMRLFLMPIKHELKVINDKADAFNIKCCTKFEKAEKRLEKLEDWVNVREKGFLDKLDERYPNRESTNLQFQNLNSNVLRLEVALQSTREELKNSIHQLRHDVNDRLAAIYIEKGKKDG